MRAQRACETTPSCRRTCAYASCCARAAGCALLPMSRTPHAMKGFFTHVHKHLRMCDTCLTAWRVHVLIPPGNFIMSHVHAILLTCLLIVNKHELPQQKARAFCSRSRSGTLACLSLHF